MQWLGSTTNELGVVVAWHTAPQRTFDDLFKVEMVIGGNGPATIRTVSARHESCAGTKFAS